MPMNTPDPFVDVPGQRLEAVTLPHEFPQLLQEIRRLHADSTVAAPVIERLAQSLRESHELSAEELLPLFVQIAGLPDAPTSVRASMLQIIGWAGDHGFVKVQQILVLHELPASVTGLRGSLPQLLPFLDDADREVRYAAGWAIGRAMDPRAVPALTARLAVEPESLVRRSLLHALVYCGGIACRDLLEAGLEADDFDTRHAAAESLTWLLEPVAPPPVALVAIEGMYDCYGQEEALPIADRIFWSTDGRPWSHLYMLEGPEDLSLRPFETEATVRAVLERLADVPEKQFAAYAAQAARTAFPFVSSLFQYSDEELLSRQRGFSEPKPVGQATRLTPLQDHTLRVIVEVALRRRIEQPLDHFDSHMHLHYLPLELPALAAWAVQCRERTRFARRTGGHPDPTRLLLSAAPPDPDWPCPTWDLSLDDRIAQRLSRRTIVVFVLIAVEETLRVLLQCLPDADWSWARNRLAHVWQRLLDPLVPAAEPLEPMTLPAAELLRRVLDLEVEGDLTQLPQPDPSGYRGFEPPIKRLAEVVARAQGSGEPQDKRSSRQIEFVDWWWRRCLARLAFADAPKGVFELVGQPSLDELEESLAHTAQVREWEAGHPFGTVAAIEDPITLGSGRTIGRARLNRSE